MLSHNAETGYNASAEFTRCWPYLQAALDRYGPTHTKAHIEAAIASGEAQLWALPNAAGLTRIQVYPTGWKELICWLAGGDLNEIVAVYPLVERFGREAGCDRISIIGRPGWRRRLNGYRPLGAYITKDLT